MTDESPPAQSWQEPSSPTQPEPETPWAAPIYGSPSGYSQTSPYGQPTGYQPTVSFDQPTGYAGYPQQSQYGGYSGYGGYAAAPEATAQSGYGAGYASGYGVSAGSSATGSAADPATPSSRSGRTILIAAVVAAVIGGGIGAGTVAAFDHNSHPNSSGVVVSTATAQSAAKIDGTVTAAAAKIQPSVVTINVAGQSESGTGSGVILRSDGYILTNNHVVAVAGTSGQIQVITTDGQSAKATIVGTDQSDDLAVVKVSGLSNLTAAVFARSSALQVGQTVVAVGAPLGLSNTVTSGIVSNTARPVETGDSSTDQAVFDAIQTDAAINPGNSGGPLVNLNGDVVGIDAAIASADSGGLQVPGQTTQSGSIGIGFAIPSDEASRIAGQLITMGSATHAVLGVSVPDSSQGNTSIATSVGATIKTVTANGPAAKAGLEPGDIVTKVESQVIIEDIDLVAAIRSYAPGQTISLTFTRAGASHTAKVTLGTASS